MASYLVVVLDDVLILCVSCMGRFSYCLLFGTHKEFSERSLIFFSLKKLFFASFCPNHRGVRLMQFYSRGDFVRNISYTFFSTSYVNNAFATTLFLALTLFIFLGHIVIDVNGVI